MIKERNITFPAENQGDQPKVGDRVKGWDKISHSETEGVLIEDIRNGGGGTTGKVRLDDGEECELFLPKKVDPERDSEAEPPPEERETTQVEAERPLEEENPEALIVSWVSRAREIKRNQASMLSDLLDQQKITTAEFEEKTSAWRDMETELEKFAKKLRGGLITADEYHDLVESWILTREISEDYFRRLEIKKDGPEPVVPPETETPTTGNNPSPVENEKVALGPKTSVEQRRAEIDRNTLRIINRFQKEAAKVKEAALGRLEKLLSDKKITAEEFENAKKDWGDFDKERSNIENQFKNKKIGPRDFTDAIVAKGNELFSNVIALEKRPSQEAMPGPAPTETQVALETKRPADRETIAPPAKPSAPVVGEIETITDSEGTWRVVKENETFPPGMRFRIDTSQGKSWVLEKTSETKAPPKPAPTPETPPQEPEKENPNRQKAIDFFLENNLASVDFLTIKDKLGLSFSETLNLVDQLESEGVLGKKEDGSRRIDLDKIHPKAAVETPTPQPKSELTSPEKTESEKFLSYATKIEEENNQRLLVIDKYIEEIRDITDKSETKNKEFIKSVREDIQRVIKKSAELKAGVTSGTVKPQSAELILSRLNKDAWMRFDIAQGIAERIRTGAAKPEDISRPETPETPETPEQKLAAARAAYAKLEYEKERLKKDFGKEKEKELEEAKKEYLATRKTVFGERENAIKNEIEVESVRLGRPKTVGEVSDESRRLTAIELAKEFKEFYDAKTAAEVEDKEARVTKMKTLGRSLYRVGQWYSKLPLRYKLGVSLGLGAASLASGSIIAAGLVGTGIWTQRILSGGATGIAAEALIKKFQDRKLGKLVTERQEKLAKEFEQAAAEVQGGDFLKGITDFLESRNNDIENQIGLSAIEIRKKKKRMAARRYLAAGTIGAIFASGLASKAIAKSTDALGNVTNFHPLEKAGSLTGKAFRQIAEWGNAGKEWAEDFDIRDLNQLGSPEPTDISDKIPIPEAAPDEVIDTSANVTSEKIEGFVKPGGSLWQTCRQMMGLHQITSSEFNHAWSTSTVDINGIPVPISEVDLSHAGDKIIFVPDSAGGHFEVHDLPDGFKLGTGEDLIKKTTEAFKGPSGATHLVNPETITPEGSLEPKTGAPPSFFETHIPNEVSPNIHDANMNLPEATDSVTTEPSAEIVKHAPAVPETIAPAIPENIAAEAETTLGNYCLLDQEELIKKTTQALHHNPNQPYLQKLLHFLENHPLHERAVENYNHAWGASGLTETEYAKIKDLKVGEYLKRYGRDLFEYFSTEKNVDALEISHRRSLAQILRNLFPGRSVKNLTVEKLLKMASFSR